MDNKIDATERLMEIVKKRNTKIIINKRQDGYKRDRKISKSMSFEGYSSSDSDE